MSETKLKRCPFCGGEAELETGSPFMWQQKIVCINCGASTKMMEAIAPSLARNKAIKQWNTRKPVDDVLERLKNASYWTQSTFDEDGYCNDDSEEVIDLCKAIEILKEVMGYD